MIFTEAERPNLSQKLFGNMVNFLFAFKTFGGTAVENNDFA